MIEIKIPNRCFYFLSVRNYEYLYDSKILIKFFMSEIFFIFRNTEILSLNL